MTASSYSNLSRTAINLVNEAKEKGLSAVNPIKLILKGSTIQGDLACPIRACWVSYAQPAFCDETQLWLNPSNHLIFKSDHIAEQWNAIHEYSDLFAPYNQINGNSNASDNGGSSPIAGQPVQDLNALRALDTTKIADGELTYVENERAIYAYDLESIDSGEGIVIPVSGVGRWLPVTNSSGSFTNLDGGLF